jgi:hypothetical protein
VPALPLSYRGTPLVCDSCRSFSSAETVGTSLGAIAQTDGSAQVFNTLCSVEHPHKGSVFSPVYGGAAHIGTYA